MIGYRQVEKGVFVRGVDLVPGNTPLDVMYNSKGCNGFLLGPNKPGDNIGVAWTPLGPQGHALTFGTSRQGGKGTNTIIPALLTYTGSMVVIDPKGENAWITAERRRQLGHRVVIIDPWNEVNRRYGSKAGQLEKVTRFNPLSALRADDPDFSEDVAAIADALIIHAGGDPHWAESAVELISGLIAAQVADKPGHASLRAVRRQLTMSDEALALMVTDIIEADPDSLAARKLGRFVKVSGEMSSIRSTAMTQTAILDSAALLDGMETDETPFELADIAAGKVTVYLVIPPNRLQTHGRWLRMLLTLMINAVSRRDRPPSLPVVFMVDEAGTLNPVKGGGLKMLEQAFGLLAGLGVVVWMFFQDLNQMQRDYPDSWETFIANSAVIQILNARDNTTTRYISEFFGEKATESHTVRLGSPAPIEEKKREPFAYNHEIRAFTAANQLLIFPGVGNYFAAKQPYYTEPRFDGFYRPNPLFPAPRRKGKPVTTIEEAAAILKAAGYAVSASGWFSNWKVGIPGQMETVMKQSEVLALATKVRDDGA